MDLLKRDANRKLPILFGETRLSGQIFRGLTPCLTPMSSFKKFEHWIKSLAGEIILYVLLEQSGTRRPDCWDPSSL